MFVASKVVVGLQPEIVVSVLLRRTKKQRLMFMVEMFAPVLVRAWYDHILYPVCEHILPHGTVAWWLSAC